MKQLLVFFSLALFFGQCYAQVGSTMESIVYKYNIDTIYSTILKEKRVVKIYKPEDFKKENKYPVFFVPDESWMFEPTVTNVKQLCEAKVIPPSIVVGIATNNRSKDLRLNEYGNFTESSKNFYDFISEELKEHLSAHVSKPAFSILVGHSDGAVFAQKVLVQTNNPFNSIIALSPQLEKGELDTIKSFVQQKLTKPTFLFISSGTLDGASRLRATKKLDSLLNVVSNPLLSVQVKIYPKIDHFAVAIKSLNDAMAFTFSDYMQQNDHNELLIDSLRKANADPLAYIKNGIAKINSTYNIESIPQPEGLLSIGAAIISNKETLKAVSDYEVSLFGKNNNYNAFYAQRCERIKEYDEALKYWIKNLKDSVGSYNEAFFYYRRPIELLANKMNKGAEAIKFAEEWLKQKPKFAFYFNLMIANVSATKGIEKQKGLKAIEYCIVNHNATYSSKMDSLLAVKEKIKTLK